MSSFNRIYYQLRPFISRRLQVSLRGKILRWRYPIYQDQWPIPQGDIRTPGDWKGWPGGKTFAIVLTHDVDTGVGQSRCLRLMNLEEKLGFVSSFNIVPERYEVSSTVRNEIVRNGYEIGVHDLKHDGKLYNSRETFLASAERINGYLKEWGAVGFRSGAMHHNLEWIHALDIEYDASTFDIDPFEPQPDGVHSIFPLMVRLDGTEKGYVELPYTLPQDFTLFVLLKEKNIDLWKKKLDWVVSKGGMALLNTHPDYLCFDEATPRFDEYPVRLYKELLEYIEERYTGQYWNALSREVARYYKKVSINP